MNINDHKVKTLRGDQLVCEDRRYVLRAYVHRYTGEHKPDWANKLLNGKPYPLQFRNDQEWLANTEFAVTTAGRLDHRAHACRSNPTWPNNPELRAA